MAIITNSEVFPDGCVIQVTGLVADADESTVVDTVQFGFVPNAIVATIKRQAGAQDVVQVDIKRRVEDQSVFDDALTITSSAQTFEEVINKPATQWKVVVDTVGVGNTLGVTVVLYRRGST